MKKIAYLIAFAAILSAAAGCKSKKSNQTDLQAATFNPYVEAFTSGKVSRQAPIYIVFNKDIPGERMNEAELNKLIKFKPSIEGTFSAEDNHTIVFRPKEEFRRGTQYEVKVDLSKWFDDAQGEEKSFNFGFSTLPFAVRGNMESLDINKDDGNAYDIRCAFLTVDKEDAAMIESLITPSEKAAVTWQHSPDGRRHEITLQGVASKEASRVINFRPGANKLGVSTKEELLSVVVPAANDFYIYSVVYRTSPEKRIEVTFSKALNLSQSLKGLVYIEKNKSDVVKVEGNKAYLYPDAQRTGVVDVYVSHTVASRGGAKLEENGLYKIDLGDRYPKVKFIGKGVVVPQTEKLSVPFQAVNVRGVLVKVIRISERNIGQFLQVNQLDGREDLMRVGRIVARKTIFLDDDPTTDLSQLNTYAIDLNELMKPEPGAIYRIELSIDKQLSAYPCDEEDGFRRLSRTEIETRDEIALRDEMNRFDGGGYYYGGYYDDEYYYNDSSDPCSDYYYYGKGDVRNIMASNLGVIAMAGESDGYTVLVHNIVDTKPEKDVTVQLFNYQNQLLGEGKTDEHGYASVQAGSGRPFYLIASHGAQRAYLRVDNGSSLSLSTFDVSGAVVEKGIKGFIYGERGVWRPGDPIHLSFMLNDRVGRLPADHPVVMELYNPLGQLFQSKTRTKGELGLYAFEFVTDPESPTGAWNVRVKVGGVTFDKVIRVEAIKPNRLKIDIKLDDKVLVRGRNSQAKMHVEWLQGATARNLKYEIGGTFTATPTRFDSYKNYIFDDPSKRFSSEESSIITGQTNEVGDAMLNLRFDSGGTSPGMLSANLVTRVFEESGDFSMDAFNIRYSPYRSYVGIESPQKGRDQLNTGQNYTYKVVVVDPDGRPQDGTLLKVDVYKVYWYWWWSSDYSRLASYVSDSYNSAVRSFSAYTDRSGNAKLYESET